MAKPVPKEMAVHTWLKKEMKKRFGNQQVHIKAPPGIYSSKRGISDFVFCVRGMYVAIEVKRAPGMQPTLIQENFLQEINNAGGIGLCCAGKDPNIINMIDNMTERMVKCSYALNQAEALFGFAGWLTTRSEKIVLSSNDDAAPVATLIKRFCDENDLPDVSDNWPDNLVTPRE